MKEAAVVIFIYEKADKYFDDLIYSLNRQTTKNFEVLIFNDNVRKPKERFKNLLVPYKIYEINEDCPAGIRFKALKILSGLTYESYIFQDCDDCLSDNRVEVVNGILQNFNLVVNDLDIIDEHSIKIQQKIWNNRFQQSKIFNYLDIENYNFVGFGNTSLSRCLLNFLPSISTSNLVATDWVVFYFILKESKECGYFTSNCSTFYRQHSNNSIGIADESKVQDIIEVRRKHYKLVGLEDKINEHEESEFYLPEHHLHEYPFWWELKRKQYEKI